jgi:hypothetical protein
MPICCTTQSLDRFDLSVMRFLGTSGKKVWCNIFGHKMPLKRSGYDELDLPYPPHCTRCSRMVRDEQFEKEDLEWQIKHFGRKVV